MKNTLTVYGCGGAGINLSISMKLAKDAKFGYAETQVRLFDTSYANVDVNDKSLMEVFSRIEDANEGSGGLRGENLNAVRRSMKDLLLDNPPSEINCVVFSAAGGSGSTIGPILIQELLASEKATVAVVLVDWSNELRTRNSYNTIRTLENIAEKSDKPIIIYPVSNESRIAADDAAVKAINRIALLFSNEHDELDNADTYNFLNYNRVTSYPARVGALTISAIGKDNHVTTSGELTGYRPISVAMLHSSSAQSDAYRGLFGSSYGCEGFFKSADVSGDDVSVIYTISVDEVDQIKRKLDDTIKAYIDDAEAARVASFSKTSAKNISSNEDDGFVL